MTIFCKKFHTIYLRVLSPRLELCLQTIWGPPQGSPCIFQNVKKSALVKVKYGKIFPNLDPSEFLRSFMKYLFVSLFFLATSCNVFAQSGEFIGGSLKTEAGPALSFFYDGDDVGFPFEPIILELQAGDYNLFGSFGFREVIGTNFSDYFEVGGDFLFPITSQPMIYLGVGAGLTASYNTIFNIRGVLGVELSLTSRLGLFGEVDPGYYISRSNRDTIGSVDGEDFGAKVRLGFNYRP